MRPELEKKVERAIRLIKMTVGEGQVEVSFSGGKDSEVILELAKMAGGRLPSNLQEYNSRCPPYYCPLQE